MLIGDVIRKCRKEKNMTQEEMAKRLGVTAPAVNKWENGNSFPDITLLSPIARLLSISVDTLLSHQQELSDAEANRLVEEAYERLKTEPYDQVFQWMKQCLTEYPNSSRLILWMTQLFDSQLQMMALPDGEKYDSDILNGYNRALESENKDISSAAAQALYSFHMSKNDYKKAEDCLAFFSSENPERKRMQARIDSETGRGERAYTAYEELLYTGYQRLNTALHDMYSLALEENDHNKAHLLVGKIQGLACLLEFGEYHEVSPALELATLEKNEAETQHIMERMLANLESIYAFMNSPLYAHMAFKIPNKGYLLQVRADLIKGFRDERTFAYMKGNQWWMDLMTQIE